MEDSLIHLYCLVDDFCDEFIPEWKNHLLSHGLKKRERMGRLSAAEVMTIIIHFHHSGFRVESRSNQ